MSYVPVYGQRRRRRDWRRPAGFVVFVLGLAALVTVADWPSAPPPPAPPRAAAVGDLLHAGRHSAVVLGVVEADGTTLAAVRFVRGPWVGTAAYRVLGCPDGGVLHELGSGIRWGWERGSQDIFAAVAGVACADLDQPPGGRRVHTAFGPCGPCEAGHSLSAVE